jgi:hypothetical protein
MFDYRLFYPQLGIDEQARDRRPIQGADARRVYRLTTGRRTARSVGRR